jgi:hypothetical protein
MTLKHRGRYISTIPPPHIIIIIIIIIKLATTSRLQHLLIAPDIMKFNQGTPLIIKENPLVF